MRRTTKLCFGCWMLACLAMPLVYAAQSEAVQIWQVGMDDNAWPTGDGGGPNATFVQEAGTNLLPGRADDPEINLQADDDYYFAGSYTTQLGAGPAYAPIGRVSRNEETAERALSTTDNSLRYHFNLPFFVSPTDLLSVTFDSHLLDSSVGGGNERYGVEIYFNGVLIGPEVDVNPGTLDFDFTTPVFRLPTVNGRVGSGFDNYVELRGISYSGSGGGNFVGVDYVRLNATSRKGDFDTDGKLTWADIDLLTAEIFVPSGNMEFDLNADGRVDAADRTVWVEDNSYANTCFGDANVDGHVDFPDFLLLSTSFGKTGGWGEGDFDGNGKVEFPDFLILSTNFGKSAVATQSVPEPDSSLLAQLLGMLCFIVVRGKQFGLKLRCQPC